MNKFVVGFLLSLMTIPSISVSSEARAQEWSGLQNRMIEIAYVEPTSRKYRRTYEILKKRKVLEELSAFLSPLRLPRKLRILTLECGILASKNAVYIRFLKTVGLCYEFVVSVWEIAHNMKIKNGLTLDDVIVGTFVNAALHEVGHAVFDILKVPVFGREEDAADQIAAFVILNFSRDLAHRTLSGYAELWRVLATRKSRNEFADEHGTPWQRFYNLLCIAYGGQPDTFGDLVKAGILPKKRAVRCHQEYEQVKFAFEKLIFPHVDQDLLKKVLSIEWAKWEPQIWQ